MIISNFASNVGNLLCVYFNISSVSEGISVCLILGVLTGEKKYKQKVGTLSACYCKNQSALLCAVHTQCYDIVATKVECNLGDFPTPSLSPIPNWDSLSPIPNWDSLSPLSRC